MKKKTIPKHGTRSRYVNQKLLCRCQHCRAANAAYQAVYMKLTYLHAPNLPIRWGTVRSGHNRRDGTIRWNI